MAKVKICGIRSFRDVGIINTLKPDYIGFVFAESKRKVTIEEASSYSKKIIEGIRKVGVFVNHDTEFIRNAVNKCCLDVIQLHGEENHLDYEDIGVEIWKSFRIKKSEDFLEIEKYSGEYFLTDSYVEGSYGGTGKVVDKNIIKTIKGKKHIIAGGLDKNNVSEFIKKFNPYCVDVSSSVETEGKKDFYKTKEFIEEVRKNGK